MSDIQEIKRRAVSIRNIGKITKSLETVSALQLKNAEKRLLGSKQYFNALLNLARKIAANDNTEESVFYNSPKGAKKTLIMLVTSDRGLVGGQNLFFFSAINKFITENNLADIDFVVFGSKGNSFAHSHGNILQEWHLTHRVETAHEATNVIVENYKRKLYSHVYLAYNEFITMQNVTPVIEQFLPMKLPRLKGFSTEIIEPSIHEVQLRVIQMYLSFVLRHALLEAEASEHAARTLAMKSASDNAGELSDNLTRKFNIARQESVTEEILGGAFHHG